VSDRPTQAGWGCVGPARDVIVCPAASGSGFWKGGGRRSVANVLTPPGGAQASQSGQAAARSPGGGVFFAGVTDAVAREPREPVFSIQSQNSEDDSSPYYVLIKVDNHDINFLVDSGANHSLISAELFRSLWPGRALLPLNINMQLWNGAPLPVRGYIDVRMVYGSRDLFLTS